MRVIRHLTRDNSILTTPSVVTIGNFDGGHLGHQLIFDQIKQQAKRRDCQSVVIIFEPQPLEYFKPEDAPVRLSSLKEKLLIMQQSEIDCVVVLNFNQTLAELSGEDFCKTILLEGLNTKHMIIGDDFRFAKQRSAGFAELESFGEQHGFSIEQAVRCEHEEKRISSTWIRQCLVAGNFNLAKKLLGRAYSIAGRVMHGDKRGRELGFPTINIKLNRVKSPLKGVFVTSTRLENGEIYPSVSNIGIRPVFNGRQTLLETHLLDFTGEIYGQKVKVEFHQRLRDEQKLASIEALKKQIDLDVQNAREFHAGKNDVTENK